MSDNNKNPSFRIGELPKRERASTIVSNIVLLGSWGPSSVETIFNHFETHFLPNHTIGKLPKDAVLTLDRKALIGDLAYHDFLFGDARFKKALEPHIEVDEHGTESLKRADPAYILANSLGSSYEKLKSLEDNEAFAHMPPALLREDSTPGISLSQTLQHFQNLRQSFARAGNAPEIAETMLMTELSQMDLAIQSYRAKGQGAEKPDRKKS